MLSTYVNSHHQDHGGDKPYSAGDSGKQMGLGVVKGESYNSDWRVGASFLKRKQINLVEIGTQLRSVPIFQSAP
jgi:hypothetical protein